MRREWRGRAVRCESYEQFMALLDEIEADLAAAAAQTGAETVLDAVDHAR